MEYYVYAVVYTQEGDLLIAKKNYKGYFFWKNNEGVIKPVGEVLKGEEKPCFPGGGMIGKDVVKEAIREFREETNVDLSKEKYISFLFPAKTEGGKEYNAAFFKVEAAVFTKIFNTATACLKIGAEAALEIMRKKITSYKQLPKNCPADNELSSCKNIKVKEYKDFFTKGNEITGWFYDFCEFLTGVMAKNPVAEDEIN